MNPYKILGIDPSAKRGEIRGAYKALILKYHPDKQAGKSQKEREDAARQFTLVREAYDRLMGSGPEIASNPHDSLKSIESAPEPIRIEDESVESINPFVLDDLNNLKNRLFDLKNQIEANFKEIGTESSQNFFLDDSLSDKLIEQETISKKMDEAENRYTDCPELVKDVAFLWKAEKEGCPPIYLFSTCHEFLLDTKDYFADVCEGVVDKVDEVMVEVVSEVRVETSVDDLIQEKAIELNKNLKSLENRTVIAASGFVKLQTTSTKDEPTQSDKEDFNKQYLTSIAPLKLDERSKANPLLHSAIRRNLYWLDDILSQKKSTLVACGSMHNSGKYGLPNLLALEGYTLTPLMKKAPTPKSVQLRELVYQSRQSFLKLDQPEPDESHSGPSKRGN